MSDAEEAVAISGPVAGARRPAGAPEPMRVFVHLARDKDPEAWRSAHRAGTLVGTNDETPYGYGRAERMGCRVTFSRSASESRAAKLVRLALRALLGFDYLHARRQGAALTEADLIWTHTESQFLAVAAVLGSGSRRPKLIGQSVWLIDRWPRLPPPQRALFRRLIRRVDLMTFHSPLNLAAARRLFPDRRHELVRYGIASERRRPPVRRSASPIRVLAVGNDRHRDWATLVEAVRSRPDMSLVILSGSAAPALAQGADNVRIGAARTNAELEAEYAAATVVAVPLRANQHASGITVIQEAVLAGVPVVATDAGGLSAYFGPDEIRYVAPGDASALRRALLDVASNAEAARAMAARAQIRMVEGGIGAESFVARHVELSRELLEAGR